MSKVYMYGIDISDWQEGIDLSAYKGQFVIIRAGYGKKVEYTFASQAAECKRLGIPYGAYWYSYALNEKEAQEEARLFLKTVKGHDIKVGMWLDMEDADGYKSKNNALRADLISAMCKAFCKVISDAGYYTGIYASKSWFGSYIRGLDQYDKWVASWGSNSGKLEDDCSSMGSLQQYTSKPLDKDAMFVPLSTFDMSGKQEPAAKPKKPTYKLATPKLTSAQSTKDGAIVVKWGKVSGAYKYRIFRRTKGKTWTRLADLTGTAYRDTKVRAGVAYTYTVRCIDAAGKYVSRYQTKGITAKADGAAIKVGDGVKVLRPYIYGTDRKFTVYYKTYKVFELEGKRAVIGVGKIVTAAVNVDNLEKV